MYYYLVRAIDNRNKLLCWDTDPMAIASRLKLLYDNEDCDPPVGKSGQGRRFLKLLYDNEDCDGKALPASRNSELKDILPPDTITAFRKPDGTMHAMIMMEHAPDENILNKMK